MKNLYLFANKFKFNILAVALCSTLVAVSSCKDDEDSPFEDVTIQFKVETTQDVILKAVVTQVGVDQTQNFDVTGTSFNSVPQIVNSSVGALHVASTGTALMPDSELIVKILVNGQMKAVDTVRGSGDLVAKTQYSFID